MTTIPPQATQMFICTPPQKRDPVQKPTNPAGLTLEAWSSGLLVGALVIMGFITVVNMRKGILLHKVSRKTIHDLTALKQSSAYPS